MYIVEFQLLILVMSKIEYLFSVVEAFRAAAEDMKIKNGISNELLCLIDTIRLEDEDLKSRTTLSREEREDQILEKYRDDLLLHFEL
jgi:hypothetical protein